MQKSCKLGARFAALEKKHISHNLHLEPAKNNLQKAQEEEATMGGNNSSFVHLMTSFIFSLLNRVTPLEQMCVVKTFNSKLV